MLDQLKLCHTRPDERRAVELLIDSSRYPALPAFAPRDLVLQLYVMPSFQPAVSWSIFRRPQSTFVVRRVRWDFIGDYHSTRAGLTLADPTTYGSDTVCPAELVSSALDELSGLSVPAYAPTSSIGIDGITFGFRVHTSSQALEFSWWCKPREGYEAVAEWYHRLAERLETALPAHTDPFRIAALRP